MTLKQVTKPLRWSNMATMPALPETQESIKEEIRRQVGIYFTVFVFTFALTSVPSVVYSHKLVTYSVIPSITIVLSVDTTGQRLMIFLPISCVEIVYGLVMIITVPFMDCFAVVFSTFIVGERLGEHV